MEKVFGQVVARKEKMGKFLFSALSKIAGGASAASMDPLAVNQDSNGAAVPSLPVMLPKESNVVIEGRLDVFPCKTCKTGRMRIVVSKKGLPFLGCNGFPNCKTSTFFPNGLSKITVLEEACGVCGSEDATKTSYMVKFEFVEEVKIEAENLTKKQTFCLNGCDDEEYKKLTIIRYNNGPGAGNNARKRNAAEMDNGNNENARSNTNQNNKKTKKRANKCSVCGVVGAHPRGFNCPGKKTRKTGKKKETQN